MSSFDMYEGPYQSYKGGALFARHCPKCHRYVKADNTVVVNGFDEVKQQPNATCAKCGRVEMPFLGYFGDDDLGIEEDAFDPHLANPPSLPRPLPGPPRAIR